MDQYPHKVKFIAFVDIVGFTSHMRAAHAGKGFKPDELINAAKRLGSIYTRAEFVEYGHTTCPESKPINRDLDYEVSQASDSVVISAEPSAIGCLTLVKHCAVACMDLFRMGLMCRGYITRGPIYHSGHEFFGTGYLDAEEKEKQVSIFKQTADERGTPFIEVDPEVVDFLGTNGDACVNQIFKRLIKTEGTLTAIYPFQALAHSFMIGGYGFPFDPDRERNSNNNLRIGLTRTRKKIEELTDHSNPRAVEKANHYLRVIDAQLRICDRVDADIDRLVQPYGRRATEDLLPGLFR